MKYSSLLRPLILISLHANQTFLKRKEKEGTETKRCRRIAALAEK